MDVKKYLEEYKIKTAGKLVSHISELKRNTKPNLKLISSLASYLPIMHDNEILEDSFKENRRENWKKAESWFCNTSDEERVKRYVYLDKKGVKHNNGKPQISLLFKQFPKALEAIAKCSEYGHEKYKEADQDYLNYQRVEEGSKAYADAGFRHRLEQGHDVESGLPHQFHVAWNSLAELELYIQENE